MKTRTKNPKKVKFREANPEDWLLILSRIVKMLNIEIMVEEDDKYRHYYITRDGNAAPEFITVKKHVQRKPDAKNEE